MIPGLGRSPGEGKGYPLQYSGLENSMNCIVHGVTKSWTQLSDFPFTSFSYLGQVSTNTQCSYNTRYGSHTITQTVDCCFVISFSACLVENPSNEDEDHERHSHGKKLAEQFPRGTSLPPVPEFLSWPEILISPLEEFHGCEYVGRIVLHSAPWCFGLALGLTRRC